LILSAIFLAKRIFSDICYDIPWEAISNSASVITNDITLGDGEDHK
jgi:hypothetical protein